MPYQANIRAMAIAATVIAGAALAASGSRAADDLGYGDIVGIGSDTLMVIGRSLDFEKSEVDVANAILANVNGTLVVIDTGGTAGFVQYLDTAAERLMPYESVLLISTHGHADHVGNNSWVESLNVPVTHFISAHDLGPMRDQVGYFATGFQRVGSYLPDNPPGEVFAQQIVDMFGGLETETANLTMLESLPLETFTIGGTSWDGWRLLDGAVLVLRTSGHTGGQVAVFLPGRKLLHLSDETTGYYQAFQDADPAANLLTLQRAAEAIRAGAVAYLTDGHTFAVHEGEEAIAYLTTLIDGATAYDAAVSRLIVEAGGKGISVPDLVSGLADAPEMANAPGGANDIPIFAFMQILNKLEELGIPLPADPEAAVMFPN